MTNTLFIDGKEVEFTNEPNLLEVIRKAGMNVPTFCYRPDLTQYGSCRMCVVELENNSALVPSCSVEVNEGMDIKTHSPRVLNARKTILEQESDFY